MNGGLSSSVLYGGGTDYLGAIGPYTGAIPTSGGSDGLASGDGGSGNYGSNGGEFGNAGNSFAGTSDQSPDPGQGQFDAIGSEIAATLSSGSGFTSTNAGVPAKTMGSLLQGNEAKSTDSPGLGAGTNTGVEHAGDLTWQKSGDGGAGYVTPNPGGATITLDQLPAGHTYSPVLYTLKDSGQSVPAMQAEDGTIYMPPSSVAGTSGPSTQNQQIVDASSAGGLDPRPTNSNAANPGVINNSGSSTTALVGGPVPLPPIDTSGYFAPGFVTQSYATAVSMLGDASLPWTQRLVAGTLATGTAPLMLIEETGRGILNIPADASIAGQLLARSTLQTDPAAATIDQLSATVHFTAAFGNALAGATMVSTTLTANSAVTQAANANAYARSTYNLVDIELQPKQGALKGPAAVPPLNANADMVRSFGRQNESAETLSKVGLDVEQLKETGAPGANPDLKINGQVADVYAPSGKSVLTVADTISYKVKSQAPNIVINLDDSPLTSQQIIQYLQANPVSGLNAVFFIKNGVVTIVGIL